MLINCFQWRKLRIKQHVEALVRSHPKEMYTSDEMALNLIFRGSFTELEPFYNVFHFNSNSLTDLTRIWHFNTLKPILQIPLNKSQRWISLFDRDDQNRLYKMEKIHQNSGRSTLLKMKSDDYRNL